MKRFLTTLTCFALLTIANAQVPGQAQEATGLRADGKIWVVMAVCITILTGLLLYVIILDRKISKLEKM